MALKIREIKPGGTFMVTDKSEGPCCGLIEISGHLPNGIPFTMSATINGTGQTNRVGARFITGSVTVQELHLMPSLKQLEENQWQSPPTK